MKSRRIRFGDWVQMLLFQGAGATGAVAATAVCYATSQKNCFQEVSDISSKAHLRIDLCTSSLRMHFFAATVANEHVQNGICAEFDNVGIVRRTTLSRKS